MPIEIRHSVIHGFIKEAGEPVAHINKKDHLLDSSLPSVRSLVEGMVALLGRRESSQVWGRFATKSEQKAFPARFADYAATPADADLFLDMSRLAVDEIAAMAQGQQASTGGHILCAAYADERGDTSLIIAMIKQKSGLQLDDDLVPINIIEVDMAKLHQAACIQVDGFLRSLEPPETQARGGTRGDTDASYLSFVAMRADRTSSGYFVDALGCEVGVTASKATARVYKAVDTIFRADPELKQYLRKAKDDLSTFLKVESEAQRPVTMEALQNVMDRVVPAEQASRVQEVSQVLNSERFKIPDSFRVSGSVVKRQTRIVLDSARLTLQFDRAMLGTEPQADLYFDEGNRALTIQNLSDDMMARLKQTLNDG